VSNALTSPVLILDLSFFHCYYLLATSFRFKIFLRTLIKSVCCFTLALILWSSNFEYSFEYLIFDPVVINMADQASISVPQTAPAHILDGSKSALQDLSYPLRAGDQAQSPFFGYRFPQELRDDIYSRVINKGRS